MFWAITQEKSKESFPIGDIFSRTFFAHMQPLTSFVSYPALDNKAVTRFLKTEGRGGESWFLFVLKYQYCPKYETGALNYTFVLLIRPFSLFKTNTSQI